MICCLNPNCTKPINPDTAKICQNCSEPLIVSLRGRYAPVKLLGQGGFGRTYLAQDRDRLNAYCVIKQFSPQVQGTKSIDKAIQLFNQEAVRLHELGEHPQIPALLAYFEDDQYLYLVQQYIEGQNLLQELHREGTFSEAKIRDILLSLLPVIQFIHDHQVIHRDITPMNILRRQRDHRLMLIDFGVAKQLRADLSEHAGTRIGTEGYSPMEQFRGGHAYPASDIYSLGATVIHLMTKMKPDHLYDPLSGQWIWRQRMADQGNQVSDELAVILDRMLKDLVNERYQSANEVLRDLQGISPPPSVVPPVGLSSSGNVPPYSPGNFVPSSLPSKNNPSARPNPSRPNPSAPSALSGSRGQRPARSSDAPPSRSPISQGPLTQPPISRQPTSRQPTSRQPTSRPSTSRPPTSRPPTSRPPTSGNPLRQAGTYRSKYCRCVYTLTAHSSWVTDVAISPTTNTFATCSLDDSVKLWNLQTGELLETFRGHSRGVNVVRFSVDGQYLLSGSDDYTVKVWDVFSGNLIRTLSGHIRDVTALAISPDGQFVMSGGEDRAIRVWQMATGKLLKTPFGVVSMVRALVASPDGSLFVSGGLDKTLRLWSMQTADRMAEVSGHTGGIQGLAISPNSQILASASKDKTVRLWQLPNGTPIKTLSGHSRDVNGVAIMPDGRLLISVSSDKTIRIWDMPTGNLVDTLMDHLDSVNGVAVHADKKTFITCSSDKTVKVWQLRVR